MFQPSTACSTHRKLNNRSTGAGHKLTGTWVSYGTSHSKVQNHMHKFGILIHLPFGVWTPNREGSLFFWVRIMKVLDEYGKLERRKVGFCWFFFFLKSFLYNFDEAVESPSATSHS